MAKASGSSFDDIAETDGKKIVAVYKRRDKNKSSRAAPSTTTTAVHDKQLDKRSWLDRGLCSRRTSTMLPAKSSQAKQQPSYQRKRVVAPRPPMDFVQEKQAHFAEVDAFELQEESPSPKRPPQIADPVLLGDALGRIKLEAVPEEFSREREKENLFVTPDEFLAAALRTPAKHGLKLRLWSPKIPEDDNSPAAPIPVVPVVPDSILPDLQALNLSSPEELGGDDETGLSIVDTLLWESKQEKILSLAEALSEFCDPQSIRKIGEGTYGEAFKGNGNVFKIVPMDGKCRVNGELQKSSSEMYSEVLLSNTLNKLRGETSSNMCKSFVYTKATRICRGKYDDCLVAAWEEWDAERGSDSDHPNIFQEDQLYLAFVLADGGTDLESFVLSNYSEARSIILQTVLALAVGEQGCGFEHRDLHWGNIVLDRKKDEAELCFRLEGKDILVKTHGISVNLIDFTLSRLDTGKQVIFCDLSDPSWFEGPEGDVQADTYRGMRTATNGQWEGSFPKTNSLWIHYLAEIIRKEKTFRCTPKDKRALCAFSKRALEYDSATAACSDKLFQGLWRES